MAVVGHELITSAPHTCAGCLTTIDGEPVELRDCSGGRVYVHDMHCGLAYERVPRARLPWQKRVSDD